MTRFQPVPPAALFGLAAGWPAAQQRKGTDGYPPYNVELLTRPDGEILRITLAVAGFRAEDLDVSIADGKLTISGGQPEEEAPRTYLHRGIATRRFQRAFVLVDGVEVVSADLHNGLLAIDLQRPVRTGGTRRIAIGGAGNGPSE